MTAYVGAYAVPNVVAFVHRFNRRTLTRSVYLLSVVSVVVMLVFKEREAFDEMHQKRLFVIHMENVRILSLLPRFPSPLTCRYARSRRTKTIYSSETRTPRLVMKVS
jgi:hypothetical protein